MIRANTGVDKAAAKAALESFVKASEDCLEGLKTRLSQPSAEELQRDPGEYLDSLIEHAKLLIGEAGAGLTDAHMQLHRDAQKALSAAHTLRLETQRQAATVRLECQKTELEHVYVKKFEDKVRTLSEHGEGSLLQEALETEAALRAELEEEKQRASAAEAESERLRAEADQAAEAVRVEREASAAEYRKLLLHGQKARPLLARNRTLPCQPMRSFSFTSSPDRRRSRPRCSRARSSPM